MLQETVLDTGHPPLFRTGHHSCQQSDFATALIIAISVVRDRHPLNQNLKEEMQLSLSKPTDWETVANIVEELSSCDLPEFSSSLAIFSLLQSSTKNCTDPRDRVFAARSLLHLEEFDELQPDYDLPYVEVFRRLVIRIFTERKGSMEWLSLALCLALVGTEAGGETRDRTRPTWVPDIHHLSASSRAKRLLYQKNFPRCQGSEKQWTWLKSLFDCRLSPQDANTLLVKGRCFARVTAILPVSNTPDLLSKAHVASQSQWAARIESFINWYDNLINALVATLSPKVAGSEFYLLQFVGYPSLERDIWIIGDNPIHNNQFGSHWGKRTNRAFHNDTEQPEDLRDVLEAEACRLTNNITQCPLARGKLCKLQTPFGYDVASLPETTQLGDQVCFFAGAPWPFAVRQIEEGRYQLLGDGATYCTPLVEALGEPLDQVADKVVKGVEIGLNMWNERVEKLMGSLGWIALC